MPAPYTLLDVPQGNPKDVFDMQAMVMAVAHNAFIRGVNAIAAQASHIRESEVQSFVQFCLALSEVIHHHHALEEAVYFPAIEQRISSMKDNIAQHKAFVPQLDEYEEYLNSVKEGKVKYDARVLLQKLHTFADGMVVHLGDEIVTLDSEGLQKAFSREEMEGISKALHDRIVAENTLDVSIPLFMVCHDQVANPWFDDLPWFVLAAVRYWHSRKHKESWEFGPCDLYSIPRQRLKATLA